MPSLQIITKEIQRLKALYQDIDISELNYQSTILVKYSRSVITSLEDLMTQPDNLPRKLRLFLQKHWDWIKGSALSYTALPEHDITQLLIQVATYVAQQFKQEQLGPLNLLMPGINTESTSDDPVWPHLGRYEFYRSSRQDGPVLKQSVAPVNVTQILKTHIESSNGLFLIPVRLITQSQNPPFNPYFNPDLHDICNLRLTEDEQNRLAKHSDLTKAFDKARTQYQYYLNTSQSLLGQLHQLAQVLYDNSVMDEGREQEASFGAYAGILNFSQYYEKLDSRMKESIPENVADEIKFLTQICADQHENIKAEENLSLCIATRRQKLLDSMRGQETTLDSIQLPNTTQTSFLSLLLEQLKQTEKTLHRALDTKKYAGNDMLPIFGSQMATLGVRLQVDCLDDLTKLMSFSVGELTDFKTHYDLEYIVNNLIKSMDDFYMLALQVRCDKLQFLTHLTAATVLFNIIRTPVVLLNLLKSLDPQQAHAVFLGFEKELPRFFRRSQAMPVQNFMKGLLPLNGILQQKLLDIATPELNRMVPFLSSVKNSLFEVVSNETISEVFLPRYFKCQLIALEAHTTDPLIEKLHQALSLSLANYIKHKDLEQFQSKSIAILKSHSLEGRWHSNWLDGLKLLEELTNAPEERKRKTSLSFQEDKSYYPDIIEDRVLGCNIL